MRIVQFRILFFRTQRAIGNNTVILQYHIFVKRAPSLVDSAENLLYSLAMSDSFGPKCHFCDVCDGHGCVGELPGMGGVFENANFIDNCAAWPTYPVPDSPVFIPEIRLAPITGALQNVGYTDERQFYHDLVAASVAAGLALSIGDGYPDEKLRYGIQALESAGKTGAVFIKPYENKKILERIEWARDVAEIIGVDIDSYAIVTMRNLVNLQKKTVSQLQELKAAAGLPFAIKGVFRPEDVELVRALHPDIVVVSNHGGRVETERGSSAAFLARYGKELAGLCGEVWVDGGIRTYRDLCVAGSLGAQEVMMGRPIITSLLKDGISGVSARLESLLQGQ